MRSAKLPELGRLAGWPVGHLAGLLLLIGALAMLWKCCMPLPVVGDFPIVERSSRGPVPVSLLLPVVVGLVAPSVQVRRRAKQAKHREPPRALRQYRAPAWFPARRSPRRYGSILLLWPRPTQTAREQFASAELVRRHLRCASWRWAGWRPHRCRKPGMQVKARVSRRFSRRHRGVGCVSYPPTQQWRTDLRWRHVALTVADCSRQSTSPFLDGSGTP